MMPDGSDVTNDSSVNLKEDNDLFKKGCLVRVQITKPTFQTKIPWSEIGLDDSVSTVASPPTTRAPDGYNEFTRLEQQMRSLVRRWSVGADNGFRYTPYKNFDKMLAEVLPIKDEYLAYAETFCKEYEDKLEQLIEEWRVQAGIIYDSLDSATVGMSKLEFVDRIEGKLRNKLPTAHGLIHRFSVKFPALSFEVPNPDKVTLKDAPMLAEYTKNLAQETFQDFFTEVVTDLRKRTAQVCAKILETMKSKGKVTEKTIKPLREHIKMFRTLNVVDDSEVEDRLNKIEAFLKNPDGSDNTDAKESLNETNTFVNFADNLKEAAAFAESDMEEIAKEKLKAMYGGGGLTGRNLMI